MLQIGLRIRLLILAFLLIVCGLAAPRAAELVQTIPHTKVEDIAYGHKDGMALTFDVLTPEKDPKHLGVILVVSGGWHSDKSDIPEENEKMVRTEHWVRGLLQGGYTLFLVRHSSAPRYTVPEIIPQIRRSVRFIRLHAAEYGIDPDHIGITSGSSGGHLSLMTALGADDGDPAAKDPVNRVGSRIQCVVAWFPPTDFLNWGETGGWKKINEIRGPGFLKEILGSDADPEAGLKSISPIYLAGPNSPPLLLIHGDVDKTVPLQQSELMKAKYEELGLPVKLVVHPGGGHTFWNGIMDDYPTVWEWFDKYLKK